jgi:hypothetical protein
MSNYLPTTLGIAALLMASTASATARSELESASVKAATDCVAAAALNNSEITTFYRENRLKEVTNWVVLRSSACDNPLNAMRLLHDRIYGQGTGQTFLRGDYLNDLPRAVGERIKVEVLRRIVQKSPDISGGNATAPGTVTPTPPPSSSNATRLELNIVGNSLALPPSMPPSSSTVALPAPAPKPIDKGTQFSVVQIGPNDVLKMRRDPRDDSPVVDTIPFNGTGVVYLGEAQGQWIFVQYDRSNGWVNLRFVSPVASTGGRIQ